MNTTTLTKEKIKHQIKSGSDKSAILDMWLNMVDPDGSIRKEMYEEEQQKILKYKEQEKIYHSNHSLCYNYIKTMSDINKKHLIRITEEFESDDFWTSWTSWKSWSYLSLEERERKIQYSIDRLVGYKNWRGKKVYGGWIKLDDDGRHSELTNRLYNLKFGVYKRAIMITMAMDNIKNPEFTEQSYSNYKKVLEQRLDKLQEEFNLHLPSEMAEAGNHVDE